MADSTDKKLGLNPDGRVIPSDSAEWNDIVKAAYVEWRPYILFMANKFEVSGRMDVDDLVVEGMVVLSNMLDDAYSGWNPTQAEFDAAFKESIVNKFRDIVRTHLADCRNVNAEVQETVIAENESGDEFSILEINSMTDAEAEGISIVSDLMSKIRTELNDVQQILFDAMTAPNEELIALHAKHGKPLVTAWIVQEYLGWTRNKWRYHMDWIRYVAQSVINQSSTEVKSLASFFHVLGEDEGYNMAYEELESVLLPEQRQILHLLTLSDEVSTQVTYSQISRQTWIPEPRVRELIEDMRNRLHLLKSGIRPAATEAMVLAHNSTTEVN